MTTAAFVGAIPENYDRYLAPLFFNDFADDLVARVPVRDGMRVLEVACGTGIVTRRLVARLGGRGHVVAIDPNSNLSLTKSKLLANRSQGLHVFSGASATVTETELRENDVGAMTGTRGKSNQRGSITLVHCSIGGNRSYADYNDLVVQMSRLSGSPIAAPLPPAVLSGGLLLIGNGIFARLRLLLGAAVGFMRPLVWRGPASATTPAAPRAATPARRSWWPRALGGRCTGEIFFRDHVRFSFALFRAKSKGKTDCLRTQWPLAPFGRLG